MKTADHLLIEKKRGNKLGAFASLTPTEAVLCERIDEALRQADDLRKRLHKLENAGRDE